MIIEHDAITGITVEREMTTAEIKQAEKDAAAYEAVQQHKAAIAAAKISALAKLAALGLTETEIAAL